MIKARRTDRLRPASWLFLGRVTVKTLLLFLGINLLFALSQPLDALGGLSLYNRLWPGRARLPYGEDPTASYNLTLNNLPAMLASHVVSRPPAADEYRVIVLGDSGVWGWLLDHDETLASHLTTAALRTADGRRVVAYNLGYPQMSVAKDLAILADLPTGTYDLVLWPITLQSLPRDRQLEPPLLQYNPDRVEALSAAGALRLDLADSRLVRPNLWGRSLVGQRRALADLFRLQLLGGAWAATGIDQAWPAAFTPRRTDLDADLSLGAIAAPTPLDDAVLAWETLTAAPELAGPAPLLLINEPIFVSDGQNSHLRYNAWYPRWAYDDYRARLADRAAAGGWLYIDLWDAIPPADFTDSPVHLTAPGNRLLAQRLGPLILAVARGDRPDDRPPVAAQEEP